MVSVGSCLVGCAPSNVLAEECSSLRRTLSPPSLVNRISRWCVCRRLDQVAPNLPQETRVEMMVEWVNKAHEVRSSLFFFRWFCGKMNAEVLLSAFLSAGM